MANKKELDKQRQELNEILNIVNNLKSAFKEWSDAVKSNSNDVDKLKNKVIDLNNQLAFKNNSKYFIGQNTPITEKLIENILTEIKVDLLNVGKNIKLKKPVLTTEQSNALNALLEDSINAEIDAYKKQLGKSFDKMSKKDQKHYGSKEEYVNKFGSIFGEKFKNVAKNTYQSELEFNNKFGTVTTRKDIIGVVTSARNKANEDVVDAQEEAAKELKDAGTTLYEAGTILKGTLDRFSKIFFQGVDDRSKVYESTFQGIAVRSNVTRRQYIDTQTGYIPGELSRQGLFNNLEISEIQQSLYDITEKGFKIDLSSAEGQAEAVGRSIDMVLTNKIVPYIAADNENLLLLAESQPNLIKQIRGINSIAMDIAGNNIAAKKYLGQMIEQLGPVSDLAEEELGVQFAKSIGVYDTMLANGYTIRDIGSISNSVQSMVNNPYGAISGGDPFAVRAYAILNQNGGDVTNSSDVLQAYLQALGDYGSAFSGASGNAGKLGISGFANMGSLDYSTILRTTKNPNAIPEIINAANAFNSNALNEAAQAITDSFAEDEKNTVKQYQTIADTNASVFMDGIKEQFGILGDVIVDAIGNITGILISWGLGSLLKNGWGKLIGNGSGGSGGGIFAAGSAGGIALGTIGGVAAVGAISKAISDAAWSGSGDYGVSEAEELLSGTSLENNSAAKTVIAVSEALNDASGFQKTTGNVFGGLSLLASNIFQGNADRNKNYLQWAIQSGALGNNDTDVQGNLLALSAIYAQNGYLSSFNNALKEAGINVSIKDEKDIGSAIIGMGMNKELFDAYVSGLFNAGWAQIRNKDGNPISSFEIDSNKFGINGINGFRQGLAKVPYDEYPALLHSGETIMTASTTATMESMIQAFKESQNQNYRIDAAIQEQTVQLVSKMNEIINTIGSRVGNYTKTNSSSEKLRDSMYRLTNPMAFEG